MIPPKTRTPRKNDAPVYELEVTLIGSEPRIWRRLKVPGNCHMGWLHAVLQISIGWTNSHLHQFIVGDDVYSDDNAITEQFEGDPPILNERKVKLMDILPATGAECIYEYDFGDSWHHQISVAAILPADDTLAKTAICLDGARACPPEDCGGLGGYDDLLKAVKNRRHPDHKHLKEWLGPFDAEKFDAANTSFWLRRLKWPSVTEAHLRKVLMCRDSFTE